MSNLCKTACKTILFCPLYAHRCITFALSTNERDLPSQDELNPIKPFSNGEGFTLVMEHGLSATLSILQLHPACCYRGHHHPLCTKMKTSVSLIRTYEAILHDRRAVMSCRECETTWYSAQRRYRAATSLSITHGSCTLLYNKLQATL